MRPSRSIPATLSVLASLQAIGYETVRAQDWHDFRSARPYRPLDGLDIEVEYRTGEIRIEPLATAMLYDVRLRYDKEGPIPSRTWNVQDGVGHLRLAESSDRGEESEQNVLSVRFSPPSQGSHPGSELVLGLNPTIPTRLKTALGAGRGELELGGLMLTAVEILAGVSESHLTFGRPNGGVMEMLVIKSGAAEFRAEKLGNARFEQMEFFGAVGDATLDFSGDWRSGAEVAVTLGLGSLEMEVPRGIGVRISKRGLADLEADGFSQDEDGGWVTPNWDEADVKLEISIIAGLGSVRIWRS